MTSHTVVVDLGFGDAGKGTVVDALCQKRETLAVIRFNGGCQAGHNVVLPDGRHHEFSQFGAGTLAGVPTILTREFLFDPHALALEAQHLEQEVGISEPLSLLTVDENVRLVTPYHSEANRRREIGRGADRHGSCGRGIGETVWYDMYYDGPRLRDARDPKHLRMKLVELREFYRREFGPDFGAGDLVADMASFYEYVVHDNIKVRSTSQIYNTLMREGDYVWEGAQGVLLDERFGFHPHTTWSRTTFTNAQLMIEALSESPIKIGVTRTYTPRHGAGPLPTEDVELTDRMNEPYNVTSQWQGRFRVGHLDMPLLRYAIEKCDGIDGLAVTHLDQTDGLKICESYRNLDLQAVQRPVADTLVDPSPVYRDVTESWSQDIADSLDTQVVMESWGPTVEDKVLSLADV